MYCLWYRDCIGKSVKQNCNSKCHGSVKNENRKCLQKCLAEYSALQAQVGVIDCHRHAFCSPFLARFPPFLVHGQVTIIFIVSVCLFVCAEFFSAVFDPISIKLGHMLYVWA